MFRLSAIVISLSLLLCLSFSVYGEVYSWKDKNGKMHFGDKKITGIQQQKLDLKVQKSKWKKYSIEVMDVDSVLTEKELERIKSDVNTVYHFFDKKLYFDIYKTVPVKIRLFKDRREYALYLSETYEHKGWHTRGVYFSKTNEIVVVLNEKQRWRTFWTIKHETSHAIVDSLTPFVPAWLNEGLAENMEVIGKNKRNFVLYPHNENQQYAYKANQGKTLNVKKFLSLNSSDLYALLKQPLSPIQAYTGELVRMLLSTKPGRSFFIRLIHDYKRGSRIYGSKLASEHYIGGLTVLQNDWNSWINRLKSQQINM